MFGNSSPTARDQFEQELYSKWQAQWNSSAPPYAGHSEAEEIFLRFFQVVYNESKAKSKKNRKKNFFYKKIFIGCLFLLAVSLAAIPCLAIKSALMKNLPISIGVLTFLDAQVLLAGGTFLFALYKLISVKKYQETWTRHSRTVYQYQLAMMHYLLGSFPAENSPSGSGEAAGRDGLSEQSGLRNAFKDQIFQIASGNLQKFSHNMEEKEKDLMEGFSELRKAAGP